MLYFTIDLFVDALVLLLHANTSKIQQAVNKLIEIYEQEAKETTYMENEFFDFYVHLIREVMLLGITVDNQADVEAFLLKFKSSPLLVKDPELFTTLKTIFTDTTPMDKDRVAYNLRKITNCILWHHNVKMTKKMFAKLANTVSKMTVEKQEAILTELTSMCSELIEQNNKGMEEEETENRTKLMKSDDRASIEKAVRVYNKVAVQNVFKTGLQGLNRAFGPRGGFTCTESIVFNALSHQGKSLCLNKFARWAVTLNKVSEDFRNPTCVIFSLENEVSQNIMQLFNEMWVNEYKSKPPEDLTEEQIVDYCFNSFKRMGWFLIIERRLGAEFGFAEFVAVFEEYKRNGYTPLVAIVDYLNMMRGNSATTNKNFGNHLLVRELYTNMCNYLKANNCAFITAHQLNRKAAELVRENPMGVVKRFTIDCLADATDPQREVDVAFYQHIETNQLGNRYLTFKLDKHRYDTETPENDKYFAYKFTELGILDDINEEDRSSTNIYAEKVEEETEGHIDKQKLNLFE